MAQRRRLLQPTATKVDLHAALRHLLITGTHIDTIADTRATRRAHAGGHDSMRAYTFTSATPHVRAQKDDLLPPHTPPHPHTPTSPSPLDTGQPGGAVNHSAMLLETASQGALLSPAPRLHRHAHARASAVCVCSRARAAGVLAGDFSQCEKSAGRARARGIARARARARMGEGLGAHGRVMRLRASGWRLGACVRGALGTPASCCCETDSLGA